MHLSHRVITIPPTTNLRFPTTPRTRLKVEEFLLAQDDAEMLSQYCKHVTYDRGKLIYNVGQHADEFYIVLSGQVSGKQWRTLMVARTIQRAQHAGTSGPTQ